MDATTKGVDENIHNTQISRYLESLANHGFLSRQRSRNPKYQITRAGLVELIGRVTQIPVAAPLERFFFSFYFVKTYETRLTELVEQKENRLPRSFQVELKALLDPKELLERQIRAVELEIRKLDERIRETQGAADLARSKAGVDSSEIVRLVETHYPYDLKNVKPMRELLLEVPPQQRIHELTIGNENRIALIWEPMRGHLENYLKTLRRL